MFQIIIDFIKSILGNKKPSGINGLPRDPSEEPIIDIIYEPKIIIKKIDNIEEVKTKVMTEISKYISSGEVTHSNTAIAKGIDNTPNEAQLELIRALGVNVFDKLREHTGAQIKINSVFRGPELNAAIKGASITSQHCVGLDKSKSSYGAAIDIDDHYWKRDINTFNNTEMGDWIRLNLDYDQLIYEFLISGYPSWIHVSYRPDGKNRKENLIYLGKGKYIPYEGNEHLVKNPEVG